MCSVLMVLSQMCRLPTNSPLYSYRPWRLNFMLVTVWAVLFFFGPENTTSIISINNSKGWLFRPQHMFPLSIIWFQMSFKPREVGSVSECCWHRASTVHSRVLSCICGYSNGWCVLTAVFQNISEHVLGYPSQKHASFYCSAVEGSENIRFWLFPLCTEIS